MYEDSQLSTLQLRIKELPSRSNEKEVWRLFKDIDQGVHIKILRGGYSSKLVTAIVTLTSKRALQTIMQGCFRLHGRYLVLEPSSPGESESTDNKRKVYIINIPISMSDEMLMQHLSYYGNLDFAYVVKGKPPSKKGTYYGFAKFKESESAQALIRTRGVPLSYSELICLPYNQDEVDNASSQQNRPLKRAQGNYMHRARVLTNIEEIQMVSTKFQHLEKDLRLNRNVAES